MVGVVNYILLLVFSGDFPKSASWFKNKKKKQFGPHAFSTSQQFFTANATFFPIKSVFLQVYPTNPTR